MSGQIIMTRTGRSSRLIAMVHVTRIIAIILLVHISHASSNSDSQNSHNQGNHLESSHDNVNKHNDNNGPSSDESQSNDQAIDDNVKFHADIDSNGDKIDNENYNGEKIDDSNPQQVESQSEDLSSSSDKDESIQTLVFEEMGDDDELLVDQMKRLSEKIKKSQGAVGNENAEVETGTEDDLSLPREETESWKTIETNVQRQTVGNIPPMQPVVHEHQQSKDNLNNEVKNQETVQAQGNLDMAQSRGKQKTLTEQMKEEVEYVKIPDLDVEPSDDADDFPEDVVFDMNQPSEHVEPITDVPISNTLPPSSDIKPSQTEIPKAVTVEITSSIDREMRSDQLVATSTPPLNDADQKQTDTIEQTEIQPTTTYDASTEAAASTAFLDMKNVGRNYRLEKKMAERNKLAMAGKESVEDLVTFTVDPISTVVVQSNDLYPTETVNVLTNTATFTVTDHNKGADMEISDQPSEGIVRETATSKPSVSDEDRDPRIKQERDVDHTVPNTADIAHQPEESEVPSMTQTLTEDPTSVESPPPQQGTADQSTDGEPTLTEEEKQKIAQAQQYFEKGEKLVNNSYKKDYIQAMEYFKLAADLGHSKSLEYLGFGHLLGDYISLDPEKALKIFTDLSDKGSPRGQLGLGFCYGSGLAVNSSQAKALIYFTFSALGGDPFAQMVLGYRYLSGIGVESKCETALQFYRKVATTETVSSGNPVVQRIRLHEQTDNKDNGVSLMDADLLQYYEFLADKGDLQAQVVLGQLYYQGGRGVPINHERAHHYFLMASDSDNANALAFLGKMHSEGSPYITQDNLTAYQYFKKAGDKGNPIGLCGMGIMHYHGRGVEKDYVKALRYFSQSADQGWSDGQLQLGLMHYSGKGVKRDYKQAVRYLNLASQGGHVLAFFHLAQMHATGVGVMRNCHTAVELYKNVAERGSWAVMLMEAHQLYKEGNVNEALLKYTFLAELGYEVAQTNVAFILDQGESSLFTEKETYQRALLQWTRAASQGSTMARLKMGDYHYYGYGTEIDYETAASHYRMATEQQHNAQAMFNLGYMHEQGLGLKQDVHLAKRFYDMAAETSGDAYVPVTLALVKLGLLYGVEVFNKELEGYNDLFRRLDIRYQLGPSWDIYLATFLAIALGIVVVIRRQR